MPENFKLTIEYDGTRYHGWQRQPNGCSIQETIEASIARMTRQNIVLVGSGRTDAGVHALGQVANFRCRTRIAPANILKGLNSLLPDDIVVRDCAAVPGDFHARYNAKSKVYRYCILNRPTPPAIDRHYVWWLRRPLDVGAMKAAADLLLGKHDFKAFEGAGSPRSHTLRDVMRADLQAAADGKIVFEIQADGFLRFMVRNIVGTLALVGQGKLDPDAIKAIMASKDRNQAGATAPPQGLCLLKVIY